MHFTLPAGRPLRWFHPGIFAVLAVAAIVRLVAIASIHSPLVSDWARYDELARRISQSGPIFGDVPTGLPMIVGSLYAVFGHHPILAEFVNLAAGLATTALVYRMGGLTSALIFALLPQQILMTTVEGTEVLYAFALVVIVWLIVERRPWLLVGIMVGLSQYLRSSAELVLAAIGLVNIRIPPRVALLLAGALIALLPVIMWNLGRGRVSASTSSYLGWQVLIGTNQAHNGRYYRGDLVYADNPWPVATARVVGDPVGFAGLVLRKEVFTWTDEAYAPFWTVGPHSPWYHRLTQLAVVGLLAVALRALLSFRRLGPAAPASLAIIAAFALAYAFTESQGRYHFYFLPLLLILSPGLPFGLPRRPGGPGDPVAQVRGGRRLAPARAADQRAVERQPVVRPAA